jgi:hypothetical protein
MVYKGFRVNSRGKYLYVINPAHPLADKRGRVALHRCVMEEKLGRYLERHEIVHHKNKNTKDNSPENLEVTTQSDHSRLHGAEKTIAIKTLICTYCKKNISKRSSKNK